MLSDTFRGVNDWIEIYNKFVVYKTNLKKINK